MSDFNNHKDKWITQFSNVPEEELEKIFYQLVNFWGSMIDNYELFMENDESN